MHPIIAGLFAAFFAFVFMQALKKFEKYGEEIIVCTAVFVCVVLSVWIWTTAFSFSP